VLMVKTVVTVLSFLFLPASLAQTTCYTNPQGTTLCSTANGVINGNTNGVGNSVYRDDRGHLLEYRDDQFGNASLRVPSGESIDWSKSKSPDRIHSDDEGAGSVPDGQRKSGARGALDPTPPTPSEELMGQQ